MLLDNEQDEGDGSYSKYFSEYLLSMIYQKKVRNSSLGTSIEKKKTQYNNDLHFYS